MIISVEDVKKYITTTLEDSVLEAKLQALETMIRKYTNNNFHNRSFTIDCPIVSQNLYANSQLFQEGDTVEILYSQFNNGLYVISGKDTEYIMLDKPLIDEAKVTVVKVQYPKDVQMGVVNLLKWDLDNRAKVGIQSETLSRHSVTYFNMDATNSAMGYPAILLGFLKPYKKARF